MSTTYWRSFLIFEKDLETASRFIEIHPDNYMTYSSQLSHLLMGACAEFDVVCKLVCKALDPTKNASSINQYYEIIKDKAPELLGVETTLPRFGISFKPMENWGQGSPPFWWTAHNKVKHHRDTDFKSANLKNVLYSIGGLLIIVAKQMHLDEIEKIGSVIPVSQVLGRLSGSSEFIELPSSWYYEW